MAAPDPVELSQALIRCPSVTPVDAGALDTLQAFLEDNGFRCRRKVFEEDGAEPVDNLYARLGTAAPNLCFAGHTDVVPPGDEAAWCHPPFAAEIAEGRLWGRGASDMKCAIAAFAVAAVRFVAVEGKNPGGSISLLITGDEEGPSINGTRKMLAWLAEQGETLDACLVGEPTNPAELGEMVKVGRRGSLNARLTVTGVQGHAAYPEAADNPIPRLVRMLATLLDQPLDAGTDYFQPSTLTVTSVDVGNPATNVIPARAHAAFNVRFNDVHTADSLVALLRDRLDAVGGPYELETTCSGEAFLTPPGVLSDSVAAAVEGVTGRRPELGTTGGTSDARFIKDYCPVAEFGLMNDTAHKVDENARVDDIRVLTDIYRAVIEAYFARAAECPG